MKKRTRIILSACLAVLLVFGIGGYAYVSNYYQADETALEAMAYQTDSVQAEQDGNVIWFVPEDPTAGLIFYPGGKVEYTAYAPLLRACAENGMIDITGVENPQIGDEIVLAGTQQEETISLAEVGEFAGTSDTEYICRQGQRLPKVYLEGGRVVERIDPFE